ncbi:exo-1,4-beta-glucosidase [Arenicella xantha]|uniref:Exo-1,4-beta-glucosidase n=2 Tax=Arenicella xantha TaxID=644221 RepID=A0A395JH03_9GAMM|nr:exo-1,4-beta-glucosidase [Arenicella xantha]
MLLLSSCNQQELAEQTPQPPTSSARDPSIWPSLDLSAIKDPAVETQVARILADMTLEQKVAQMIQPEIRDVSVEDMRRYGFGSYLNGGGAFPNNNKHATPSDWIDLAEAMYQASIDDSLDGSTIPTIWGTDAVHGHNNVIGATLFPHNIGLGAANNPTLIESIASATAREVMATGIDWVFAPTVAVVRDDRWGRTYEGYSEDPEIVRSYSTAIVRGLQGSIDDTFLNDDHVIATVKHFLGDGGTQNGIDQGNNIDNEQALFDLHAQGYVGGLSAGAQSVMASFNSWHGEKMHGHRYLLTDILKNKMGFDGFVVGDWLGHGQIDGCTNADCSKAINAGLDVFMAPSDAWKPLFHNTVKQAQSGEIPMSRINDAVTRILRVKVRAGVFSKPSPANRALSGRLEIIGAPEHRAIARQAVRESLVLLKNNQQLLPLKPQQRILVAGDAAHNIGKQSGGWTITWQGTGNKNADFPGGTSIYDGIENAVSAAGGSVELAVDGNYQQRPDVAIVVFGEEPYAEGNGDIKTLDYQAGIKSDLKLLRTLKAQNIPVVSVFISGRPMWVNAELNASDAFVAAWLPGSEGVGISDVLLRTIDGDIAYDFTGKLSYSWPALPTQSNVNRGDRDTQALLPYGFGLSYGDKDVLSPNLPENSTTAAANTDSERVIFRKSVQAPFSALAGAPDTLLEMTSNVLNVDGLQVRTRDRDVQEDARQLQFSAGGQSIYVIASNTPIDLQTGFSSQTALRIQVKLEQPPSEPVTLTMQCGDDCAGAIDIADPLTAMPLNEWHELSINLRCFAEAGVQLATVTRPIELATKGDLQLSFSDITIAPSDSATACP